MLLPCSHVLCSDCVPKQTKHVFKCPSCESCIQHHDLMPADKINCLTRIYKNIDVAVASHIPLQRSQDTNKGKLLASSNILTQNEASGAPVSERSKKRTRKLGPKILIDNKEKQNPLSLGGIQVIYCEESNQESEQDASGPVLHLSKGKEVDLNQSTQPDIFHVHDRCVEWAPTQYNLGETCANLEAELASASKFKCSKCGSKGASLRCFVNTCRKRYHFKCASEIPQCSLDSENHLMLCSTHSKYELPCNNSRSKSSGRG